MKDFWTKMTRREAIKISAGIGAGLAFGKLPALGKSTAELISKPIPSTGEMIPVVGIGTARNFNLSSSDPERAVRKEVISQIPELGGKLIDTAPSYGRGVAEPLIGELMSEVENRDKLFLATKVRKETTEDGIREMERSFVNLKTDVIDLMQVHNLMNWQSILPVMKEWKAAGRFRYVGMTTSSNRQHEAFEEMMEEVDLDFIQVNYSLRDRAAADRLLPLAADRGMAVLVNLPYGRGRLFDAVGDRPLPDWAKEIDCESWGQVFLKYVVSHPAVTCAIPGTYKMAYLTDNFAAATGAMPDTAMRQRMEKFFDTL